LRQTTLIPATSWCKDEITPARLRNRHAYEPFASTDTFAYHGIAHIESYYSNESTRARIALAGLQFGNAGAHKLSKSKSGSLEPEEWLQLPWIVRRRQYVPQPDKRRKMSYSEKRINALDMSSVQKGNQSWWTTHTMSYDWNDKSAFVPLTLPWFDDIDRRFLHATRMFSDAENPFEQLMHIEQLAGKRVLEIGCGMGFHSEMLARAGAVLSSIDLSPTSVKATKVRLDLKNLSADVREMDGEFLTFPSDSFDMVWSWGVIHHSARSGRIVREIGRVLRPGGVARLMVYNLEGMPAYVTLATSYLLGFWRGQSLDETLWRSTDGFLARFYTKDQFADLLATFFDNVETSIFGQDSDVVPLPRYLRRHVLKLIPPPRQRKLARRRGAFLLGVGTKSAALDGARLSGST
jgi:2-polyprenyl-3-methyl-5-hydroxy-6-metoxy-1,4-benzoquinol methylase